MNSINDHPTWKNLTWRAKLNRLLRPVHDIRSSIIPHTWHCWRAWQLNIDWWIRGPCTSLASDECTGIIPCFLTLYTFLVSFTHTCDLISFSLPFFPLLISYNSFYSCFVTSVDWIHQCFETTFPPPNAISYSPYTVNFIAGCLGLYSSIHLVVFLTTGPKPLPKRALHIVRSRASFFRWEYPLLSVRSSSSFLCLLPRLSVISIPTFIFPSITCRSRQFLRRRWPIQLAFCLLISYRIFLCSLTLSNTYSFLTWSVQLIFSIFLHHHI
jgi:hypothetical protein